MRKLLTLLAAVLALIFMAPSTFAAESGHEEGEGKLDPKEIIFEHLGDGYGWEVPFNHHKRIPLPVIVIASDGLHVFSSSRVTDGQTYQDGNVAFKIAGKDSQYKGKVVEIKDGKEIKPIDISITKNVCGIFITVLIVVGLMLWMAHFHRKYGFKAPRKGLGAIEALIVFMYDSVVKSTLGDKARKLSLIHISEPTRH